MSLLVSHPISTWMSSRRGPCTRPNRTLVLIQHRRIVFAGLGSCYTFRTLRIISFSTRIVTVLLARVELTVGGGCESIATKASCGPVACSGSLSPFLLGWTIAGTGVRVLLQFSGVAIWVVTRRFCRRFLLATGSYCCTIPYQRLPLPWKLVDLP